MTFELCGRRRGPTFLEAFWARFPSSQSSKFERRRYISVYYMTRCLPSNAPCSFSSNCAARVRVTCRSNTSTASAGYLQYSMHSSSNPPRSSISREGAHACWRSIRILRRAPCDPHCYILPSAHTHSIPSRSWRAPRRLSDSPCCGAKYDVCIS